jgi:two-component system, OmpR family, heavy metal sensor histidine kinase CusS
VKLALRHRLALLFATAVGAALLVSGAATIGVLALQTEAHRQDEIRRGIPPDDDDLLVVPRAAAAMAIVAPLAVAGAAVLGLYLARRALAPMREASRRVAAARASELDLTLPVTGADDEWDDLASTLNALLADARGSMFRVRRFTADAAHELRTPVTTILGEAEVALRRKRTEEELRAALVTVKEEAGRIAQLLEALLSLARADAGILLSSTAVFPLGDVLDAAVARARERASQTGHAAIRMESSPANVLVEGNRPLLSRALENLLDNAVRHARSQVTVTIATDGTTARIRVADDGPGISPELVSTLFERFARGDRARSGEGFGLGLSISRAIAQAHGGTLDLRPSSSGAVFELALPETAAGHTIREAEPAGALG